MAGSSPAMTYFVSSMSLLILDFDGVVLESVEVKTNAFVSIFPTSMREVVLACHRETPGLGRTKKIECMFRAVFGRTPSIEEIDRLRFKFAEKSLAGVMNCPEVPGLRYFLESLPDIETHIVSAAPEDEVRMVSEQRNLAGLFQSISGMPIKKEVHLARLLAERQNRQALFIGDRISDLKAAQASGVRFLGRVAEGEENPFPTDIPIIADFISGRAVVERMLT
jgi:phosphoglycolate phosphatase-like HAD superfamily hydrolase